MPRCALLGVLLLLAVGQSHADDPLCRNANVLSGALISDICWECMLPLRIAGITFGSDSGEGGRPPDATGDMICACDNEFGVPMPGFVTSFWQPSRLIETVRQSGCSPSLGGIRLPLSDSRRIGVQGGSPQAQEDRLAFMHVHYYSFPLLVMMELFIEDRCMDTLIPEFDLLYMTELDPTWNNDLLAFFTHPESAITANPIAIEACAVEAMKMAGGGWPVDKMFWCLGAWGNLYPLSGAHSPTGGFGKTTAKVAARQVAALHRRGLERRTMGAGALCEAKVAPMLPKTMYKMSHFWPRPDANRSEKLGSPRPKVMPSKNIPGAGEDAVILLWRYNDCCTTW